MERDVVYLSESWVCYSIYRLGWLIRLVNQKVGESVLAMKILPHYYFLPVFSPGSYLDLSVQRLTVLNAENRNLNYAHLVLIGLYVHQHLIPKPLILPVPLQMRRML